MNYYQSSLKAVEVEPSDFPIKVKFIRDHAATNWLDLNSESIAAIREFLDALECAGKLE